MDLDKLKNTWQNAEARTSINEEQIQQILDKRGQTALEKLVKYEKLFFKLIFACLLFLPMFWFMNPILFWIYLGLILFGFFWQKIKINLLKRINIEIMNILDVSTEITRYKKYLVREFSIGLVGIFLFMLLMFYLQVIDNTPLGQEIMKGSTFIIIYLIVLTVITFGALILVYYKLYWKNIKAIQSSLDEIHLFKQDNNE